MIIDIEHFKQDEKVTGFFAFCREAWVPYDEDMELFTSTYTTGNTWSTIWISPDNTWQVNSSNIWS